MSDPIIDRLDQIKGRAALLAAQKVRANHKPEGGES